MDSGFVGIDEFVNLVSAKTGLQKQHTRATIDAIIEVVCEILIANKRLQLRNFGVFKVVIRKARVGRIVKDKRTDVFVDQVKIPERKRVVFKPSKFLNNLIGGETRNYGG